MRELQNEMKGLWDILNQHGIYTEEDLIKVEKNLKLDIGVFTTPIPQKRKESA